jgi:hypothetical protein
MSTFTGLVFLIALVVLVIVVPMYFMDLFAFGKILVRDHADLVGRRRLSFADAYGYLQKIRTGQLGGAPLSPEAVLAHERARRLLYIATSVFMAMLFAGLANALLNKHGS